MKKKKSTKLSYKDLFDLNQSHTDFILKKSLLTNQYAKNVALSGAQIEVEVRKVFSSILPDRFKVTHGYIALSTDRSKEPTISGELDLIIVDTLVPHKLFLFDDKEQMELVPFESVLGIFEIKRTLNKKSINEACQHLSEVMKLFQIDKTNNLRFLPGGFTMAGNIGGGFCANPIIGIVSLDTTISLPDTQAQVANFFNNQSLPYPDIVHSLNGKALIISFGKDKSDPNLWYFCNPKEKKDNIEWHFDQIEKDKEHSLAGITTKALGFIVSYLASSCAKSTQIVDYYFNKTAN